MEDLKAKQKQLQMELDKINRQLLATEDKTFSIKVDEGLMGLGFTRDRGGSYSKTIDDAVELTVEPEGDGNYYFTVNCSDDRSEFDDTFSEDEIIEAVSTFKIFRNTVTVTEKAVFYTLNEPDEDEVYHPSAFDVCDTTDPVVSTVVFKVGDTFEDVG